MLNKLQLRIAVAKENQVSLEMMALFLGPTLLQVVSAERVHTLAQTSSGLGCAIVIAADVQV